MKNGWYFIKTWERMEREYGLNEHGNINTENAFSKVLEGYLPPTRCVYIKDGEWFCAEDSDDCYGFISEDMIEAKAFKLGELCKFSDNQDESFVVHEYAGYINNTQFCYIAKAKSGHRWPYKYCEEL